MTTRSYVAFTVEGRSEFPIDMLRYDGCHPRRERDSGVIKRSLSRRAFRAYRVELAGKRLPTTSRWESFGWKVVQGKIKRVRELQQEEGADFDEVATLRYDDGTGVEDDALLADRRTGVADRRERASWKASGGGLLVVTPQEQEERLDEYRRRREELQPGE